MKKSEWTAQKQKWEKEFRTQRKKDLTDGYIISLLKANKKTISPELIIEKRTQLFEKRKLIEAGVKCCTKCKEVVSTQKFNRQSYKVKKNETALKPYCKKCEGKIQRTWRKKTGYNTVLTNRYRKKYPEKVNIYARQQEAKHKQNLTDIYITTALVKSFRKKEVVFKKAEIPQELIDLKRKELTLKRKIENGNKKTNTKGS